jgi:hypothetical protein
MVAQCAHSDRHVSATRAAAALVDWTEETGRDPLSLVFVQALRPVQPVLGI